MKILKVSDMSPDITNKAGCWPNR